MGVKHYGTTDVAAGLEGPNYHCDQSEYEGVPGHNTPMHPGFDTNTVNFRKGVASKYHGAKREQASKYRTGGKPGYTGK